MMCVAGKHEFHDGIFYCTFLVNLHGLKLSPFLVSYYHSSPKLLVVCLRIPVLVLTRDTLVPVYNGGEHSPNVFTSV
jgi:hypothetical protein